MTTILVVDHRQKAHESGLQALKSSGFKVVPVEKSREALEKYKAEKPDLVLFNVAMPDGDSIASLKEILKFERKAQVIMIATTEQRRRAFEGLRAGAKDFLTEPLDSQELLTTLKKYTQ